MKRRQEKAVARNCDVHCLHCFTPARVSFEDSQKKLHFCNDACQRRYEESLLGAPDAG